MDGFCKPFAGIGVAMGEYDCSGFNPMGIGHELFSVGVAAEIKTFYMGADICSVAQGFEKKFITLVGLKKFAARGVWVTIPDETNGIVVVVKQSGSDHVGWGMLDEHAAADEKYCLFGKILPRVDVTHELFNPELFNYFFSKINAIGAFRDLLKVVSNVHSET